MTNSETILFQADFIAKAQKWILENCHPSSAKEFEILGRALKGCTGIVAYNDGSVLNGFGYLKRRNWINADCLASNLIDNAILHVKED